MTEKKYDLLVFIGRFQPFHIGHKEVVDRALGLSEKVLMLVGSSGRSRTVRNPWTFDEREKMIRAVYPDTTNLSIEPINDHTYNDTAWIVQVRRKVKEALLGGKKNCWDPRAWQPDGIADFKVGLIGCKKDNSSYYLDLFKDFDSEAVEFVDPLNATEVRKMIFDKESTFQKHELDSVILPHAVANILFSPTGGFTTQSEYEEFKAEYEWVKNYRKPWESAPYPPFFKTVDALVEHAGHILLVKRRSNPGKNLWALPGGFVNVDEPVADAVFRELGEETLIKVPEKVLRGSVEGQRMFDDPYRSDRGRIITTLYHIVLKNELPQPKVKGADDALKAKWWAIDDIREEMFFEDHYHMIKATLGI
jgi:bifunctional NMN adenylyltransferase/nudix hydrolase